MFSARRLLAASAIGATVLMASACSAPESPASPEASPSPSAEATSATAQTDSVEDVIRRVEAAEQAAGTVHTVESMTVQGRDVVVDGDAVLGGSADQLKMDLTVTASGMDEMRVIVVDGTTYMNLGAQSKDKFIDTSEIDDPTFARLAALYTAQADLAQNLDSMLPAVTGFTATEDAATIDGVSTTEYVLEIDPSKLPAGGDAARSVYTVYVGPDDLPRRSMQDIAGSSVTVDYSRWGEPVSIEAPPAEQIIAYEDTF